MTEEQIERRVERRMDTLDNRLMRGEYTQREYDDEVTKLNLWSLAEFRNLNR